MRPLMPPISPYIVPSYMPPSNTPHSLPSYMPLAAPPFVLPSAKPPSVPPYTPPYMPPYCPPPTLPIPPLNPMPPRTPPCTPPMLPPYTPPNTPPALPFYMPPTQQPKRSELFTLTSQLLFEGEAVGQISITALASAITQTAMLLANAINVSVTFEMATSFTFSVPLMKTAEALIEAVQAALSCNDCRVNLLTHHKRALMQQNNYTLQITQAAAYDTVFNKTVANSLLGHIADARLLQVSPRRLLATLITRHAGSVSNSRTLTQILEAMSQLVEQLQDWILLDSVAVTLLKAPQLALPPLIPPSLLWSLSPPALTPSTSPSSLSFTPPIALPSVQPFPAAVALPTGTSPSSRLTLPPAVMPSTSTRTHPFVPPVSLNFASPARPALAKKRPLHQPNWLTVGLCSGVGCLLALALCCVVWCYFQRTSVLRDEENFVARAPACVDRLRAVQPGHHANSTVSRAPGPFHAQQTARATAPGRQMSGFSHFNSLALPTLPFRAPLREDTRARISGTREQAYLWLRSLHGQQIQSELPLHFRDESAGNGAGHGRRRIGVTSASERARAALATRRAARTAPLSYLPDT